MKKREFKDAAYWEKMIQAFLGSGLTLKAFSQEQGICRHTLANWSKRLGISVNSRKMAEKGVEGPPLSFLEVSPSLACFAPSVASTGSSVKCELTFSQGHILKLEVGATWAQVEPFLKSLTGSPHAPSL